MYLSGVALPTPPPVSWMFCDRSRESGLSPANSFLVGSTLWMQLEGRLSRWYCIIRPLFASEEIQSCVIHTCICTGPVIHDHNKLLQTLEISVVKRCHTLTEFGEGGGDLFTDSPCLLCWLLPFATESRQCRIQSMCERMGVHLLSLGRLCLPRRALDPSKVSSLAKHNPHFFKTKLF